MGNGALRMIKVIFFDAVGTLFHLPRGVGWHYRTVAERHGWSLGEEALNRAFFQVWKEMPDHPVTGVARSDDHRGWWRELVERVLDRCGNTAGAPARAAYFEELYAEFIQPGVWELFPEVREVLAALRPHFKLGVISNFDGRLRAILGQLDLGGWFEPLVISSEVGADKPAAWIFERALALAQVTPGEALHVGDDPVRDWEGAVAAGLHVFRLRRPDNSLRDLAAYLTVPTAS
jgi:putative hydrolase of the HAD superfamily